MKHKKGSVGLKLIYNWVLLLSILASILNGLGKKYFIKELFDIFFIEVEIRIEMG